MSISGADRLNAFNDIAVGNQSTAEEENAENPVKSRRNIKS